MRVSQGFWGTREHWQNIEGNKGTLANFWEQENKIRKIEVRKHSERVWEHGNIEQFWKGTREQGPLLGDPQAWSIKDLLYAQKITPKNFRFYGNKAGDPGWPIRTQESHIIKSHSWNHSSRGNSNPSLRVIISICLTSIYFHTPAHEYCFFSFYLSVGFKPQTSRRLSVGATMEPQDRTSIPKQTT